MLISSACPYCDVQVRPCNMDRHLAKCAPEPDCDGCDDYGQVDMYVNGVRERVACPRRCRASAALKNEEQN